MSTPSKYEPVAVLGAGPRATVYRGRHAALGIEVAIKQFHPTLSPRTKQRLFAAVDRWARCAHDNVLGIRDVDVGREWVISDIMAGSCAGLVTARPVSPDRVREILLQSLTALDFLHARRNCLHANLKPSNLLYDEQGRIRLSDGFAVALEPGIELPPPGQGCKYLAPEMLGDSSEQVGPAADLYCLGFIALELLIGPRFNSLFRGLEEDAENADRGWVRWHLTAAEAAPRAADYVDVPNELAIVIERLTCKDLVQRYRSAGDALHELTGGARTATREPSQPAGAVFGAAPVSASPGVAFFPQAPLPPGGAAPNGAPPLVAFGNVILPRPATSVVLRIASGTRAGEMVGLDAQEVHVGGDDDCQLKFSAEQYAAVKGRRVLLRREASGWTIRAIRGGQLIVNRQFVAGPVPLRSGDMVRLSLGGPDFQFILQNPSEQSLAELAAGLLEPTQVVNGSAAPAVFAPPGTPAPTAAVPAAAFAPPLPPTSAAQPAAWSEPVVRPPAARPDPKTSRDEPAAPLLVAEGHFWDYRSWSKTTRNWVVGIIATIVAAIVIYLVPTGGKTPPSKPPERTAPSDSAPPAGSGTSERSPSASMRGHKVFGMPEMGWHVPERSEGRGGAVKHALRSAQGRATLKPRLSFFSGATHTIRHLCQL